MTSRELVLSTLEFRNAGGRAPRQMWTLPWAHAHYPEQVEAMHRRFPPDITAAPAMLGERCAVQQGDPYAMGEYTDEWGCRFVNIHPGVIGEVKKPIVAADDEEWEDISRVHIPTEWLTVDKDAVNAFCAGTDQFVLSGACPRPFEQLQFIRGTEQLYVDLMLRPQGMLDFLGKMHKFYREVVELWCETDVDGIQFMDDWGAQSALLINPETWKELFLPLYRDYIAIAHRHGKKAFMHSDGHTLAILPHLIECGLDAINCQIFCMGVDNLAPFRGKICFWGEIDRQHILPEGSIDDVRRAVRAVHDALWQDGGCIAQCEFGPGGRPENVREVFACWDNITGEMAQ